MGIPSISPTQPHIVIHYYCRSNMQGCKGLYAIKFRMTAYEKHYLQLIMVLQDGNNFPSVIKI